WHPDGPRHGTNDVAVTNLGAQLGPALEVEGPELAVDDARNAQVQQRNRPPDVGNVDGLVVPVEDQNGAVHHQGRPGFYESSSTARGPQNPHRDCPATVRQILQSRLG